LRIRTQFIITMLLFGGVLAAISASAVITNRQVQNAIEQEAIADTIVQGASELGYLASDYVIYREAPQLERWEARFASFAHDVSRLQANEPEQEALVYNLEVNAERLRSVFDSVAAAVASRSQGPAETLDPVLLQVSWSRMAVQTQGLVLDASRLSQIWDNQVHALQNRNTFIVIALIGVLAVYFVANYFLIQRRMLGSLARLQAGTTIVGSGDLDFRIEVKENDEVGDLSRAFNRMADDLKAAAAEIMEERRAYQERFEAAPDAYVVTDKAGIIKAANRAMGKLVQVNADDLVGRNLTEFVVASDVPEFREHMARLHSGQVESPWRWEVHLQPDGNEAVVHAALAATVAYTAAGEFEVLRWLLRDVTREKQMHAALVHAGKLSIAGRLAASLAHEINNPLSAALGCADLAVESFQAGEDPSPHLRVLCDALGRTSRVVTQLRELHGDQRSEEKLPADLNELVEKVLLLARKKADSAGVKISWEPVADLPRPAIMVDSMQQVFLNLTLNAIEAMEGQGLLDVRLRHTQRPQRVGVAFADNGPGISSEVLEVLFEPFNTTKARGSGLGLFICQNIVQQHGGSIEVETLAGEGTTFTVWLPL